MTRLDLIEQYEDETELPATWNNGGMGGYTKEYTNWLEQKLVKNLAIPVVVCSNCPKVIGITVGKNYKQLAKHDDLIALVNDYGDFKTYNVCYFK